MIGGFDWIAAANRASEVLAVSMGWVCVWTGVVVAVVYVVCGRCPRLPAATRAAIWWLVCVAFPVGLLWQSPISLPVLPPAKHPSVPERIYYAGSTVPSTVNWLPSWVSLAKPAEPNFPYPLPHNWEPP